LDLRDGCLVKTNLLPSSCFKLIRRSRAVNVRDGLVCGAYTVGDMGDGAREDVTANDGEVGENFSDFAVGRNKVCERAKVARGCRWQCVSVSKVSVRVTRLTLASVVLGFRLVGREDLARILLHTSKVLVVGIPHEVLEDLIRILLPDHEAGSLDDIAVILNEFLTVCRKLGLIHDRVVEDIFERGVDLLIGGITPLSECLYGTVEVELSEEEH
jgi:hypothetical protein